MVFRAATLLVRAIQRPSPSSAVLAKRQCIPRHLHASHPVLARRVKIEDPVDEEEALEMLDDEFDDDDAASAGHLMLREQRQTLHYLRLIEHEMPKLVAYRKPFVPPESCPLIVRSLEYSEEDHPASSKRAVVVSVDELPLRDLDAVHKIKLLAGPRWSLRPPADAGVSGLTVWGNGFIKISCEDFVHPAQNLKWISDTLDRLIAEANTQSDKFRDIPLDVRHIYTKVGKAKKGEHLRGRIHHRPTIHDFPQEWLPDGDPNIIRT